MSKVPRPQIASVLVKKLAKSPSEKHLANEIAAYLLEENRTGELDSLLRDVINLRAENGLVEVTAVSTHELSPAATSLVELEVKRLYPAASKVIVSERIDLGQIGGVRLEFPDKQLDLSIRNKLNKFKQLTTTGL